MSTATLTIDMDALVANWRALDQMTSCETAAVVKADAYGLGAARVARGLARAGARRFFVAAAEEGAALRSELGTSVEICVFSGHMAGDTDMIGDMDLIPMINSVDQLLRHVEALPGKPFGVQLDTGMNRLGMEPAEWAAVREIALSQNIRLIMSHLACADEPDHPMNSAQLKTFREMTDGVNVPRSFSATGGILLGPQYHFDVTRPGVGIYGGQPFSAARAVAHVDIPVIQIRDLAAGETVGYSNTFTAPTDMRIATVAGGYADGIMRALGHGVQLYYGDTPCPVIGRISMDLITVDVSHLSEAPDRLALLNGEQTVDTLADIAGTIGYEILTSLGNRYARKYRGDA